MMRKSCDFLKCEYRMGKRDRELGLNFSNVYTLTDTKLTFV